MPLRSRSLFPLVTAFLLVASVVRGEVDFDTEIHPILQTNCFECHSHAAGLSRGSLVLDSRKGMIVGGDHGSAIIPGDAAGSLLIQAVRHTHRDIRMPKDGDQLPEAQMTLLERWIDEGAVWPQSDDSASSTVLSDEELVASHWAYSPPVRPQIPILQKTAWQDWARNDLDRFVAAKLEAHDLSPGEVAPDLTLRRRLAFDLTGLPPLGDAPQDLESFIDSLYASQEHGRKFGRHWLDVARYADTAGDNADYPVPEMALYRDYVVDAFKDDLPFDEFLTEQIAGDLMDSGDDDALYRRRTIATTFVAASMRFCDDLKRDLPLVIDETVDAVGQAFMGMTMSCAKCHDHKSEPIPTKDYYAMYGIFASTRYPYAGREGRQVPINLVSTSRDKRAAARVEEINRLLYRALKKGGRLKSSSTRGRRMIALAREQAEISELAFAVRDEPKPRDAHVHFKGDWRKKREKVPRGVFSVITPDAKLEIPKSQSGRLQFAKWLTAPGHPLTARVMANRIWSWHFGKGLVATPNNFGISGALPTHPELLDYLAHELIDSGWSVRHISRLITSSATYRQAVRPAPAGFDLNSSNSLYWTASRRRLAAEEIRDSALVAAGLLDFNNPGKHNFPLRGSEHFTQHRPYEADFEHNHRSIYLVSSRIRRQEFSTLFDAADPTSSTGQRRVSTVPLQALYLLNNDRYLEIAEAFGRRLAAANEADEDAMSLATQAVFSRPITEHERSLFSDFLKNADTHERSAWSQLAHALLLSNEAVFLD